MRATRCTARSAAAGRAAIVAAAAQILAAAGAPSTGAYNARVLGSVLGVLIADARLQTRAVLVELRGAEAHLAVGALLSARLPGAPGPARGVVLPRGARAQPGG